MRYCAVQNNTTLVLRFRDLVTEAGETILKHKAIIDEKGYVWWAWWKKGAEITPTTEFGSICAYAQEKPLCVYLLDSGQEKLYKAQCCEIKCTALGEKPSPEPDLTPEYYKNKPYFAWFKFSSIEECVGSELNDYSYLDSDSLFKDGETDYRLFYNKKVFSLAELIQQNRTVWFLREFKDGDKENEIILLNANLVEPYIFSELHKELMGDTFLWLSDMHFSNGVLSVKNTANKTSVLNHIKQCLDPKDLFNDISSLIISGDITDCVNPEGYQMAEDFIVDINREGYCKIDADNILICPGNHDLKRIEADYPNKSEPELFCKFEDTNQEYSKFFKDIYNIKPNKFLASGRKYLTKSGQSVDIAAINTIMLQQYKDFEGHGYITQEQLDFVEESMQWKKDRATSSYRIVVMHHHYCPACLSEKIQIDKPSSVVYDADRLLQWLVKNNIKLLLHGHKHNKFISKISTPISREEKEINASQMNDIFIVSAGGIGAKGAENRFGTLTFTPNELCIRIYKIFPDNVSSGTLEQTINIPLK